MFTKTILLIIALTSSKAISLKAEITRTAPKVEPQLFLNAMGPAKLA